MSILEARPCGKRSGVNFQKFVNMIKKNPAKIDILLARALLNDEQLDRFDGQGGASECVFSYPNKDWFGVYLVDSAGNKVEWGEGYMKYYFKLKVNKLGSDAAVTDGTVDLPDDLKDSDGNEIDHCVLRGTKCGDPESMRVKPAPKGRTPKAPVAVEEQDEPAPRVASQVSPVLLQQLEDLSLGSGKSTGKSSAKPSAQSSTITREFFEQMKTKEMIVEWMINNMDPKDLIKCVKKGSLSKGDLEEAEKLASSEISEYSEEYTESPSIGAGTSGTSGMTNADLEVIEMARNIPESELTRMLKKVTKESISELINKISDKAQRKEQLVLLCKRAGINKYSAKKVRNVLRVFEGDDQIDDEEIPGIVDECAAKEATKLRRRLLGAYAVKNVRLSKGQPVQQVQQGLSVEQISRLSPEEQKLKIVELSGGTYFTKEVRGKLKLFDSEGQLDEEEIPGVIADVVNAANSFGKRRRRSLKRRKNNN